MDEFIEIIPHNIIIENDKEPDIDLYRYIENNQMKEFRHYVTKNNHVLNEMVDGKYLINEACRLGRVEFITFMILMGCTMKRDKMGMYPQHYAAQYGKSVVIDIMAMFGIRFNVRDNTGSTPLHYASSAKNTEMISTLINYGADPNIRNKKGLSANEK